MKTGGVTKSKVKSHKQTSQTAGVPFSICQGISRLTFSNLIYKNTYRPFNNSVSFVQIKYKSSSIKRRIN